MIVEFKQEFDNDLSKCDQKIIKQVFKKIYLFKKINNLNWIWWIKKLRWYKYFYRIRIWDYRLWFSYKNNKIILERFLHRKDIYKYYP